MKVLLLSLFDPWAEAHGGTLRTRAFLRAFDAAGCEVVCVFPGRPTGATPGVGVAVAAGGEPLGTRRLPAWLFRVKRMVLPIPTAMGARSRAVAEVLRAEAPDLLCVHSVAQAAYADALPGVPLWFDMSDLLSEFAAREAASRPVMARHVAGLQRRQIMRAEAAYVARSVVATTAGWSDAHVVAGRTGAPVEWLPTPVDVAPLPMPDPAPRSAGFIANFAFSPNTDAWQVLVEHWLPPLLAAGWDVVVAGLGSESLPDLPGVQRLGRVGDVAEFYERVSLTLAPIRLGGGMKVKVVESLLAGRPVVASDFAVEGFPPEIRSLVTVVDVERPDLSVLHDGLPAIPAGAATALSAFRADAFGERLGDLLGRLG